jgi:hypothetical protein
MTEDDKPTRLPRSNDAYEQIDGRKHDKRESLSDGLRPSSMQSMCDVRGLRVWLE